MNPQERKVLVFWRKLPPRRRGLGIIAIPITCLIASLGIFILLQVKVYEKENKVIHAQKIDSQTRRLLAAIINAETGVRGYLITPNPKYLEPYNMSSTIIEDSFAKLKPLIEDNFEQQENFQQARNLTTESLTLLEKLRQRRDEITGDTYQVILFNKLTEELDDTSAIIEEAKWYLYLLSAKEERQLVREEYNLNLQKQFYWLVLGIVTPTGILASLFAIYLICRLESELQEKEERLRQSNQLLSQVNEQLQLFTANASHELRNPLAAMLSNAQVGLLAPINDLVEPRQRLEKIVQLSKSMSELINNLLFLARQQNIGELDNFQAINLAEFLTQIVTDFSPQAQEKNIRLTKQFPVSDVVLKADKTLLRQAVTNLVSNALHYTPSGGTVSLKFSLHSSEVIIEVEDTGMGIPIDDLSEIFKPFYRVDKVRSRRTGGYGLGLAIVKQIIQAHGGDIQVYSTLNRGSIFQIKLSQNLIIV